jgi:hypothetical protein
MPKLRYPLLDEDRLLKSKIVFSIFEIVPPSFEGVEGIRSIPVLNSLKSRANIALGRLQGQAPSSSIGASTQNLDLGFEDVPDDPTVVEKLANQDIKVSAMQIRSTGDIIDLYLPRQNQVLDNLNYDNNSALNISGAAALRGINAGSGALQSLANGIIEGTRSISDFFTGGSAGVAGRLAATRLAASPAGIFVPEGVRNAIGLAAQVTVNPNLATTFNGVNIRNFNFQFKFLPKSAEESREVKKIIKMLRMRAYPDVIPIGDIPVGYKYPDIFKIRLLSGKSGEFENVGTPVKLSYLQQVQAEYNTTSQTFHEDGSPTEIDLQLTFLEHRALNRQDILAEDNDDYYEYYGRPADDTVMSNYQDYADANN